MRFLEFLAKFKQERPCSISHVYIDDLNPPAENIADMQERLINWARDNNQWEFLYTHFSLSESLETYKKVKTLMMACGLSYEESHACLEVMEADDSPSSDCDCPDCHERREVWEKR